MAASASRERAAVAAAIEADAIEPVVSPRTSCLLLSSTSTDESSQCSSGRGRFRRLRVSIRRRRKSRPLHLHVPLLPRTADASRRSLPQYRSYRRRVSMAPSASATDPATRSVPPRSHWDVAQDLGMASTPRTDASTSPETCDLERPSEYLESRRRRAWSKIKGRVRLPRLKSEKKATVMFSISFYPWKMEARGYYSNPEAAVEWVPDTASSRCQICLAAFNLARRRHHCRLCGHLVCNECSLQRTFLPFSEEAHRRSNHSMIKSGEAQRTCNSCSKTLKNMVAQNDHRVKEFSVDVTAITVGGDEGAYRASSEGRSSKAGRLSHTTVDTASPELQLQLVRPRTISKVGVMRNEELDQVLKARAKSRAVGAVTQQYVISSEWLEQWLQFVQLDSSDSVHNLHTRPSITSRSSLGSRRRSSRLIGRRPGPIANYALLDFVNGKLIPREGLRRSRGAEGSGDYRVISHEVWLVFRRLYGGGPCIIIDENIPHDDTSACATAHAMIVPGSILSEVATSLSSSLQWIITEIDDAISTTPFSVACDGSLEKTFLKDFTTNVDQNRIAVRALQSSDDGKRKASSKRPASATAIRGSYQPSTLARSTSESTRQLTHEQEVRRSTSIFAGYFNKLRHREDSSRASVTSATFSQIDDKGVVLYDPLKDNTAPEQDDVEDNARFFPSSQGPTYQRDTIAAVSAFAAAAAEARRKSTMSLMRHSTAVTTRSSQSSVMSA